MLKFDIKFVIMVMNNHLSTNRKRHGSGCKNENPAVHFFWCDCLHGADGTVIIGRGYGPGHGTRIKADVVEFERDCGGRSGPKRLGQQR